MKWIVKLLDADIGKGWLLSKVLLGTFAGLYLSFIALSYNSIIIPIGICDFIPCEILLSTPTSIIIALFITSLAGLYMLEIAMIPVLWSLSVLAWWLVSVEESNGILSRSALIPAIFMGQALVYTYHRIKPLVNVHFWSMQISMQLVAGAYAIAALSKIDASGLDWGFDTPYLTLQLYKGGYYDFYDTGSNLLLQQNAFWAAAINQYPLIFKWGSTLALLLELTIPLILLFPRWRLVYGVALLCMHAVIGVLMDIMILPVVIPMVAFVIVPGTLPPLSYLSDFMLNKKRS